MPLTDPSSSWTRTGCGCDGIPPVARLKELPALSKGQTIVAGAAVNTPVLCRVRQRITEHGAEDVDAPARWREWFARDRVDQRERDLALPAEPETRGRSKLFKT
jgi:hypothetical protein